MTDPITASQALFTDDSMVRRVHREGVVMLGGGRALLMQLAQPAVAEAVARHSAFPADGARRLLRTLRRMLTLAFGTPVQIEAAAAAVNTLHEGIVGAGYDARDPALLLWVLATLIDSALVTHALFLRPLSDAEAQAYYEDMLRIGALLGVDPATAPRDIAAFNAYVSETLDTLVVTPAARSLARHVLRPVLPSTPLCWPLEALTAGLLPSRLRAGYDLDWGPHRETALRAFATTSRAVLPRVPLALRGTPSFLLPPR